jgi:predicted metal-dependent phosphoesterase TrpH
LIDLHTHTTASDGVLAPDALVAAARAARLTVVGITDHDTVGGLAAAHAAAGSGLEIVDGIEISAVADGRDVHVLGYFIDPDSPPLRAFLDRQRADRLRRVEEMAARLAALGCAIDASPVLEDAARGKSVGRPQIADALLAAGHVARRDEAFDRFLEHGKPAYVPRRGASPEGVIEILHAAGGIVSLAHPGVTGRDHAIRALVAAGLDAIEAWHSDHDALTAARYCTMAAELGVLVTGGSDFHGESGHRTSTLGLITLPAGEYARLRQRAGRSSR